MKQKSQNQESLSIIGFKDNHGITMLALLITIIILVILTAVIVKTLTGDNGIIGVATNSGTEHEIKAYWEQITRTVQGEITSKATVGETATADSIIEALNAEDWIKLAKKSPESTEQIARIDIQVVDGYIYQIYYNLDYGKLQIDYMGKDIPEDKWGDMTLVARYEIANASIYATAEDKKNGVAKLELIYKDEVVGVVDNPNGEQSWRVDKIGPGWYKIKATSNSGMIKTTWVKARNFSDSLSMPSIEIQTEGTEHNGWYGADKKDLYIKVSTTNKLAKEIHYCLTGAQNEPEKIGELQEDGGIKYICFQITEVGLTKIRAWTEDGNGYQSEENTEEVKYDNVPPQITGTPVKGTQGNNEWYTSEVEIGIEANDPKGILEGYTYSIKNKIGAILTPETKVTEKQENGTYKPIKNEPNMQADGEYTVTIQAEDQAGNKSAPATEITIKKDTERPTVGEPKIENITGTSFRVSVSAGDATSGIDRYEYYLNGNLTHTSNEGTWTPNNLTKNTKYNVTVKVYDKAGLSRESIVAPVTTTNTPPTITAEYANDKGTDYITFSAIGRDADGDKLIYTLYVSTDGINWGTAKATSDLTTPGQRVTLKAEGLKEYTEYYWRIDTTDGIATATTGRQNKIRTYCNSFTLTCPRIFK